MTTTTPAAARRQPGLDISYAPGKPPLARAPEIADTAAAAAWVEANRESIAGVLSESGSLLVRGLPVRSVEAFAAIRDAVLARRASYAEQATPRSAYGSDVYSATDLPPAQEIRLHNENSYTLRFPGMLVFGCLVAPEQGGATVVGDVRQVLGAIPPELSARFRETGWLLARSYGSFLNMSWARAFGTSQRSEVSAYCQENLIGCEWQDGDQLRTVQRRAAIVRHPVTGAEVWFNHVAFWNQWSLDDQTREVLIDTYGGDGLPFDTFYGDGSAIAPEEIAALNDAYASATVKEPWRPGDVLIVDNILTAHGREPFRGERKILVAMGEPVDLADCHPTVAPAAERTW
jgi:alpha-ketoglutarate-dependent taurine dioxygenase